MRLSKKAMVTLAAIAIVLSALFAFPLKGMASSSQEAPAEIEAQTAVLMDATTGQILYNKNMNQKMHPASITKILTGLLVVENTNPKDNITVSKTATEIPWDSATIWLKEGERITVEEAMYALMVNSANDAANALAEHVAGSQEAFVQLMNQRSAALGAKNTRFENAHGLTSDNHKTTAYDMALITQAAMRNPEFLSYFGVSSHQIPATNLWENERFLYNHHYMLRRGMWAYRPEVLYGKTGYTLSAGNTLCTVAEKSGMTLICIVMKSTGNGKYTDTMTLLDYGFDQFSSRKIVSDTLEDKILPVYDTAGQRIGEAYVALPKDGRVCLPKGTSSQAVQAVFDCPESIDVCHPAPLYLNYQIAGAPGGSTTTIHQEPLEYSIRLYPPLPYATNSVEIEENAMQSFVLDENATWKLIGLVLALSAVFLIGIVFSQHLKSKKDSRFKRSKFRL